MTCRQRRWLRQRGGWSDDSEGRESYAGYLAGLAGEEATWEEEGIVRLSRGWAIGTSGWRKAVAEEYSRAALARGLDRTELKALREAVCERALEAELGRRGRKEADLVTRPRKQPWKLELAQEIRKKTGANIAWLARRMHLGQPDTVRGYLHQLRNGQN